jgi:hypothetical protein
MSDTFPNLVGDAALWYAKQGLPVFPLHTVRNGTCSCGCANPECNSRGKHPRIKHSFKDATTNAAQIRKWWSDWPDANIGIPTGEPSRVLLVDIDPRNGGAESWDALVAQHGALPDTAEQISGGDGRHKFFQDPGGIRNAILAPGIDIKANGGYFVAAPSIHFSGRRYQWVGIEGAKAILHLADPPAWLLERIGTARKNGPRAEPAESVAQEKWRPGERNNRLMSIAGAMRRQGMAQNDIEAMLLEANGRCCAPPLTEGEVRQIAKNGASYAPAEGMRPQAPNGGSLITRVLSDIEAKPINLLWPGRIAHGKVTIIAGNPGLGKSQITASIAAVVTMGGSWPVDRGLCERGNVVFLTAEDDAADTLRPRLEAAGADPTRVHLVEGVVRGYTGSGASKTGIFSLQEDLEALETELMRIGNVAAVVIDPVAAYLGKTDSHKNAEVRGLLAPLCELAARQRVAVIAISHLSKMAGAKALMRVIGSLAFVAAARAAYLVASDPADNRRRLFLPMKNNLGPTSDGLAFRIEGATAYSSAGPLVTSRVSWESEPVTITADEALQAEYPPRRNSALDDARQWLHQALVYGSAPVSEIQRRAEAEGIALATLRRAARELQVKRVKSGMKGGWHWSLPGPKVLKSGEDAQEKNVSTFGDDERLREPEGAMAEEEF